MVEGTVRVLLVEDDENYSIFIRDILNYTEGVRFEVSWVATFEDAQEAIGRGGHDVYLFDYYLGARNGLDLLRETVAHRRHVPVIMMTGMGERGLDLEAMKAGASDYLVKGQITPQLLERSIRYALGRKRTEDALRISEEHYRDIVEHSLDLICTHDLSGKILTVNKTSGRILGYEQNVLVGMNLQDIVDPEFRDGFDSYLKTITREGVASGRLVVRTGSGERRILEYSNTLRTEGVSVPIVRGTAHDVTGWVSAEKELQESETRFRQLAENIHEVFWMQDLRKPGLVYISPAYEQVWGRSCESLYEQPDSFMSTIHPEDRGRVDACLERQRAGETTAEKYRVVRPDGSTRWVWDQGFPIRDHAGRVYRVAGIAEDITVREEAEEALRESAAKFRLLFENNPQPMWVFDVDTLRFLEVNDAAILHYGYTREEFLSMRLTDIRPEEDLPRLFKHLQERMKTVRGGGEWRHRRKDGTLIDVLVLGHNLDFGGRMARLTVINDVTERKRMEAAIRQSESRYRQLMEQASDAICLTDKEGHYIEVNSKACRLLGYAQEELLRFNLGDLIPKDDLAAAPIRFTELLAGGELISERRLIRKDGSLVPVEISSKMLSDGRIIAILRNITERKRAEESRAQLAALVEASADAIIGRDLNGTITSWNRGAERIFGYSAEEAVGQSINIIVPGDHADEMREMLERTRRGERLEDFEATRVRKDGKQIQVALTVSPIKDEHGHIIGASVTGRDITERKQLEERLHEADRRAIVEYERLLDRLANLAKTFATARDLTTVFHSLLDFARASMPASALFISLYDAERETRDVVYLWYGGEEVDPRELSSVPVGKGPAGRAIKTGKVVISNDYLSDLGDRSRVQVGFETDPRMPRSGLFAPMIVMGRTVGTIEVQSYDLGAYAEEHATAMRMAANLAAVAIENVRMLERERMQEEQLRQAQKMEAIGRLAGGVAHDFNNLLTAIIGYSDIMLGELSKQSSLHESAEQINKAGQRAAALTRQLLAFSRKQVLQPRVMDLNAVIIDLGKMLKRLIGEDIELLTVLRPDMSCVNVDPGQIEQVILNLAINARDAMPEGGRLVIETSEVEAGHLRHLDGFQAESGKYVVLAVSDTGCGMDEQTQANIFEPFFTTKGMDKGTGLGLSTVYGIVKQSGGYIAVESRPDEGATFSIYLPAVEQSCMPESEPGAGEYVPRGTETVLVVEDDPTVRELAAATLRRQGYQVIEAADGLEGLRAPLQVSDGRVDLLLTDVVMPKMNGKELAECLTNRHPGLKVLFMSGYADDALGTNQVLDPETAFIQKPFTPADLARKVRDVLERRQPSQRMERRSDALFRQDR